MTSHITELLRNSSLRGAAPVPLSIEVCTRIGRAFGTLARQRLAGGTKTVVVGRSADGAQLALRDGLVRGLIVSGHDVVDVGVCASEVFTFALKHLGSDAGTLVTSSEGAVFNLFFFLSGQPVTGEHLQTLCAIGDGDVLCAGVGSLAVVDVRAAYATHVHAAGVELE